MNKVLTLVASLLLTVSVFAADTAPVQNKADAAQNKADAAQNKADSAQGDADAAQDEANAKK